MVRRLLRVQLRLKVMAGVLAVTLVALVAFDVAAVTTVRRNLLNQTDNNLQVALTLTLPRLAALLPGRQPPAGHGDLRGARAARAAARERSRPCPAPTTWCSCRFAASR